MSKIIGQPFMPKEGEVYPRALVEGLYEEVFDAFPDVRYTHDIDVVLAIDADLTEGGLIGPNAVVVDYRIVRIGADAMPEFKNDQGLMNKTLLAVDTWATSVEGATHFAYVHRHPDDSIEIASPTDHDVVEMISAIDFAQHADALDDGPQRRFVGFLVMTRVEDEISVRSYQPGFPPTPVNLREIDITISDKLFYRMIKIASQGDNPQGVIDEVVQYYEETHRPLLHEKYDLIEAGVGYETPEVVDLRARLAASGIRISALAHSLVLPEAEPEEIDENDLRELASELGERLKRLIEDLQSETYDEDNPPLPKIGFRAADKPPLDPSLLFPVLGQPNSTEVPSADEPPSTEDGTRPEVPGAFQLPELEFDVDWS